MHVATRANGLMEHPQTLSTGIDTIPASMRIRSTYGHNKIVNRVKSMHKYVSKATSENITDIEVMMTQYIPRPTVVKDNINHNVSTKMGIAHTIPILNIPQIVTYEGFTLYIDEKDSRRLASLPLYNIIESIFGPINYTIASNQFSGHVVQSIHENVTVEALIHDTLSASNLRSSTLADIIKQVECQCNAVTMACIYHQSERVLLIALDMDQSTDFIGLMAMNTTENDESVIGKQCYSSVGVILPLYVKPTAASIYNIDLHDRMPGDNDDNLPSYNIYNEHDFDRIAKLLKPTYRNYGFSKRSSFIEHFKLNK